MSFMIFLILFLALITFNVWLPYFIMAALRQHVCEGLWLKKYKFIPDGMTLVYMPKKDKCVLHMVYGTISRKAWFALPDEVKQCVKWH